MSEKLTLRQEIYLYDQQMLAAQYVASENISHKVTKGTTREQFIKSVLLQKYSHLKLQTGILECGYWQSTQADLIWLNNSCEESSFSVYNLHECKMFMEVKSFVQASEIADLDAISAEMKQRHREAKRLKTGMFCYKTSAKKKTIARKFGVNYDETHSAFGSYNKDHDIFPNIDFLFSLDLNEDNNAPYLLIRDISGACQLNLSYPVINYFFALFAE